MTTAPVIEVEDLVKHFHVGSQFTGGGGTVRAVDGVSLAIGPGELVGEPLRLHTLAGRRTLDQHEPA